MLPSLRFRRIYCHSTQVRSVLQPVPLLLLTRMLLLLPLDTLLRQMFKSWWTKLFWSPRSALPMPITKQLLLIPGRCTVGPTDQNTHEERVYAHTSQDCKILALNHCKDATFQNTMDGETSRARYHYLADGQENFLPAEMCNTLFSLHQKTILFPLRKNKNKNNNSDLLKITQNSKQHPKQKSNTSNTHTLIYLPRSIHILL